MCNDNLIKKIERLKKTEMEMISMQVDRLLVGYEQYGDWNKFDVPNLLGETIEEIMDALQYLTAILMVAKKGYTNGTNKTSDK